MTFFSSASSSSSFLTVSVRSTLELFSFISMCVADVDSMFSGLLPLATAFSIAEDSLYFADFSFWLRVYVFCFRAILLMILFVLICCVLAISSSRR